MTDLHEMTNERRSEHRRDILNALDRQIRALKDEFERHIGTDDPYAGLMAGEDAELLLQAKALLSDELPSATHEVATVDVSKTDADWNFSFLPTMTLFDLPPGKYPLFIHPAPDFSIVERLTAERDALRAALDTFVRIHRVAC